MEGGYYAIEIFNSIISSGKIDCFYNPSLHLNKDVLELCNKYKAKLHKVKTNAELSNLMQNDNIEALFSAIPYGYYNINTHNKKFLMTIHGLRDLECISDKYERYCRNGFLSKIKIFIKKIMPGKIKNIRKKRVKNLIVDKNIKVITGSLHSKYSIINHFPQLCDESIDVCPPPTPFNKAEYNLKSDDENNKDYFLLISANRWIKNNYRAIKALDSLFSDGLINKNVIVLGIGNNANRLKNVKNKDRFKFYGYVEFEKLQKFFQEAYCFIYPTLNEGYGYPPIQAMQYGVPVLASACTSIPEVCKDAVLYFNPLSIDEIKTRILTVYYNSKVRNRLSVSGLKHSNFLISKNNKYRDSIKNKILEMV